MATAPIAFWAAKHSTLVDGRILVTGRGNTFIYISDSNVWDVAATVPASFSNHGQSTLNDGRVLVSVGLNSNGSYRNTSYAYIPSINVWTNTATLPVAIRDPAQSTLLDGSAVLCGGVGGNVLNTAYMYIPNSTGEGSWENAATMPASRYAPNQSTLLDGKSLLTGGTNNGDSSGVKNTTFLYLPSSDTWTDSESVPREGFRFHGQSTLTDGRVLISGGSDISNAYLSTAYIYTPAGWED